MFDLSQDAIADRLLRSPRLPFYLRRFQTVLEAERARREQFYEEITEDQKVEFINGEVVVQSPVKLRHSQASDNLFTLLSAYVRRHQLGMVRHEKVLVTLTRNDYEPDICFFKRERAQKFSPEQIKFPAPDFVVEVLSPSTEEIDRGVKFEDYALHGVAEYWIVDPDRETVEQYALREGAEAYELRVKVQDGRLHSVAVEGFSIPVQAIFDNQMHLKTLRNILGD